MEFWYLCHPLAGDIENNLKKNAALARKLALQYPDRVIFSPLAATSFMREPEDREMGLRYCFAFLRSEIFTGIMLPFPEWLNSKGCQMEFRMAYDLDMKIEFIESKTGEVYRLNG
ncbi:MAG: hypothetical protein VR68_11810 [Peptococcaceae bacterium BRH_c4a]|nr:MAG: hypothetical protein VR68_11810 [Peptococcaceae bacterium BRH_c4a]